MGDKLCGRFILSWQDNMGRTVRTLGGIITDTTYSLDGKTVCTVTKPENATGLAGAEISANAYDGKGNNTAMVENPSFTGGEILGQNGRTEWGRFETIEKV